MPFERIAPNVYQGPSGKKFNLNQVKLYYSNGGKFPGQKKKVAKKGVKPYVKK